MGRVVADGNGKENHLNQLNWPASLFVDEDSSLYVSDLRNNRVMKWIKGAKEGIVVAGEQYAEKSLAQLNNPQGVLPMIWVMSM
jgi:sugar lactone lactonase YvrE